MDTLKKNPEVPRKAVFDADITVYPFGLKGMRGTDQFFIPYEELNPSKFTEEELKNILTKYWSQQKTKEK
jgi:hypothetical protein